MHIQKVFDFCLNKGNHFQTKKSFFPRDMLRRYLLLGDEERVHKIIRNIFALITFACITMITILAHEYSLMLTSQLCAFQDMNGML